MGICCFRLCFDCTIGVDFVWLCVVAGSTCWWFIMLGGILCRLVVLCFSCLALV